jgi:hypothetical protein
MSAPRPARGGAAGGAKTRGTAPPKGYGSHVSGREWGDAAGHHNVSRGQNELRPAALCEQERHDAFLFRETKPHAEAGRRLGWKPHRTVRTAACEGVLDERRGTPIAHLFLRFLRDTT